MARVIRYRGPKGGYMQEMLCPTSFVKGQGYRQQVAMLTDGRYSGELLGLAISRAPRGRQTRPDRLIKEQHRNIDIRTVR